MLNNLLFHCKANISNSLEQQPTKSALGNFIHYVSEILKYNCVSDVCEEVCVE